VGVSRAPDTRLARLQSDLAAQQRAIETTKRTAQADIDALTEKLALLQAHVVRVDALGGKLVKMAGIDPKEFDFSHEPGIGGPDGEDVGQAPGIPTLSQAIDSLTREIENREQQLKVLDHVLLTRNLRQETTPSGRPINHGWISSYFGMRSDPFTGRHEFHEGIDFAGKMDTKIHAVASGVVTWAGKRWGYGNLVELNHGNGYVTRYGHCDKVLVHVGEPVKKGQVIALMGSTGRSTGPHVHFEVIKNGRKINPIAFIQSSSRLASR
jgi:murein DD-endopeptidase MepM/ murein hydrolase activator NlpD